MRLGRQLARLEDLMRLRHRRQVLHSVRLTLGIVGTMRVLLRLRLGVVVVVVGGLWCTTRRAWCCHCGSRRHAQ